MAFKMRINEIIKSDGRILTAVRDIRKNWFVVIIFLCVIIVSFWVYQHTGPVTLTPQSVSSVSFVTESNSIIYSLQEYSKVRAPLYPMVLYAAAKIGLSIKIVNFLFFGIILLLIILFFRVYAGNIHWIWPVLLYSSFSFNYYNMTQYVSETMLIALCFGIFYLLLRYLKSVSSVDLAVLSLVCSAAFITRYFALFWIFPITIFIILRANYTKVKQTVRHIAIFSLSLIPIIVWMLQTYKETGHFSGMDRFAFRAIGEKAYWNEITTLKSNMFFTIKTVFIDFFCPEQVSTHDAIEAPHVLGIVEYVIIAVIAGLLLLNLWNFLTPIKRKGEPELVADISCPTKLLIWYSVVYLFSTILLWTIGNNDPIYTRFLYPFYPFAVLLVFCRYSYVKDYHNAIYQRLGFNLLYILLLAVNCYKSLLAVTL